MSSSPVVQQVFPVAEPRSVAELYDLSTRRRHPDRPWVVLTMISAADGSIAVNGHSAALGNDTDRAIFLTLRRSAQVILVGAATVRADSYSPVPDHQQLVVVSSSGDLGANHEKLHAATSTTVVAGDIGDITRGLTGEVCVLEGGPSLNAQMLAADLVDEVCLTLAPRFPAGTVGRMAHGPLAGVEPWSLAHIAEDAGFVFLRYLRQR
ncbi:MAG: dihydrofolate reductase family protein [Actinomycetota bacterium]